MTVLYNQFCITQVVTDLKTKSIIITTNFKVDPSTVDFKTVTLYDCTAGDRRTMDYSLQVNGKNIIILLDEMPTTDTRVYLKVSHIYDALNRKLNYAYNNYIDLSSDVETQVEVLSPGFREALTDTMVSIKLKIIDPPLTEGRYVVQISSDSAFFKIITTCACDANDESIVDGIAEFNTIVDFNGQLFIRARAEKNDIELGRWSEPHTFSILTMSQDSMDTSFLEESITTYELFPDEVIGIGQITSPEEISIANKNNIADIKDGVLYIEFNKDLLLPEDYEIYENGYVSLGIITGFRKELK
jgi:hypothetical protein